MGPKAPALAAAPGMLPKAGCLHPIEFTPSHRASNADALLGSDICCYHETGKIAQRFLIAAAGSVLGRSGKRVGARAATWPDTGAGQLLTCD